MGIKITIPDWIRDGVSTLKLTELNPAAAEASIETLRAALPENDDRVWLFLDL